MTYQEVMDLIRADIDAGVFPVGEKLPSTAELTERFKVEKGVLERAIRQLRSEGVVTSRQGYGVVPLKGFERINRVMPDRLLTSVWGEGKMIQDQDTGERDRELDPPTRTGEEPAPLWATDALELPTDAVAAFRKRIFVVDGRTVQLSTSYVPVELARGTPIMYTDPGPGGTYNRLKDAGWGPTHFREVVVGRAPDLDEVKALKMVVRGEIVLEITRTAWCGARPVEVNRMVLDAKAYVLTYRFSADQPTWEHESD